MSLDRTVFNRRGPLGRGQVFDRGVSRLAFGEQQKRNQRGYTLEESEGSHLRSSSSSVVSCTQRVASLLISRGESVEVVARCRGGARFGARSCERPFYTAIVTNRAQTVNGILVAHMSPGE